MPYSSLKIIVTRRANGVMSSLPPSLASAQLYLHNVGKRRSYLLRYDLGLNDLAISGLRGGILQSRTNLLPSTRGGQSG